jgi:hypothetical protein
VFQILSILALGFVFFICFAIVSWIPLLPFLVIVYIAVRLSFFENILAKSPEVGLIEALTESWNLTKGKFWEIFVYEFLIGLAVFLPFVILSLIPLVNFIVMLLYSFVILGYNAAWVYVYNYFANYADYEHETAETSEEEAEKTEGKVSDVETKEISKEKEEVEEVKVEKHTKTEHKKVVDVDAK